MEITLMVIPTCRNKGSEITSVQVCYYLVERMRDLIEKHAFLETKNWESESSSEDDRACSVCLNGMW